MGRHNGNAHAHRERERLQHQPAPARLDGENLRPDDRVTIGALGASGRVLWCEWRDLDGNHVDPTGRPGRDKRKGAWHALVLPDAGVSRLVPVANLTRERIAR